MELLTGKTKEDFEKYTFGSHIEDIYLLRLDIFKERKLCVQQAYITEWLDSVGIFIDPITEVMSTSVYFKYIINIRDPKIINKDQIIKSKGFFNHRNEAITEAIKQANKIYNERTK